jgi:hypothetical protein
MHLDVDKKIELLGAVMDGMESPEERNLMAQAMRPVACGLPDRHRGAGLEPDRPTGEHRKDAAGNDLMDREDSERNRRPEHEARQEPAEKTIAKRDRNRLRKISCRWSAASPFIGTLG